MTTKEKLFNVLNDQRLIDRMSLRLGEEIKIETRFYTDDRLVVLIDTDSDLYDLVVTPDDEVQISYVERINSLDHVRKALAIAEMIQTHLTMNKDWRKQFDYKRNVTKSFTITQTYDIMNLSRKGDSRNVKNLPNTDLIDAINVDRNVVDSGDDFLANADRYDYYDYNNRSCLYCSIYDLYENV